MSNAKRRYRRRRRRLWAAYKQASIAYWVERALMDQGYQLKAEVGCIRVWFRLGEMLSIRTTAGQGQDAG